MRGMPWREPHPGHYRIKKYNDDENTMREKIWTDVGYALERTTSGTYMIKKMQ